MAGVSEQSFDPKRTVVVLNLPSSIEEDDLTIHFQKAKHGGGDVDEVEFGEDKTVAFVIFDAPEVVKSVLAHKHHEINGNKLKVEKYQSWLANKKKKKRNVVEEKEEEEDSDDKEDAVTTIYVSGIKETTTQDSICLFFENKKRSGGGDLREDKEGYKRISPSVARLTFLSSKDARNVLKKSKELPLKLEGSLLTVTTEFVPTHDRSILLASNLNPETNKETFKNFVESIKNVEVLNVVFGKNGKAIVMLKNDIDEDSNEESSGGNQTLGGSVIALEFARLTKGIKISNIPPETTSDDVRYKFSNKKIGGGQVTDMMLDKKNGVANVYFEESSVVSKLVKKKHKLKDVVLTVIPYYDDFEELEEVKIKTTEFSGAYPVDPLAMDYIFNYEEIEKKFDFKSMRYDHQTSRFHFTKDFDDGKLAQEFENELKEFLCSFVKDEVRIPKGVLKQMKEDIESKRDEFEAEKIDLKFDGSHVFLVGKKENVADKKKELEAMMDRCTEEAKKESIKFPIDDKTKLKFLNFVNYFNKVMTEFPEVSVHGMDNKSGELTLVGTMEKIKDVKLKIFEDLTKISETVVNLSDHQIDFLQQTDCQIVNDEFKNDDVMLLLTRKEGVVGVKSLQANIMTLKKCDNKETKRLTDIVHARTTEKCIKVDQETASFLAKSDKLHGLKKKMFDKDQVLIDQELTDNCKIWIVCEESKMTNAEQELTSLTDEKQITSSTFKPMDSIKIRFLKEHCWGKIKEKEKSFKAEGVVVLQSYSDSLEVKGTKKGRLDMITYLDKLAGNIYIKEYALTEPGMKKQLADETTDAVFSDIEKNHKCIIKKCIPSGEADVSETVPVVVDGGITADASGSQTMNLPYQTMSYLNDKEVKMVTGHKISIVIGDIAHQSVDVIVNTTNDKVELTANPCGKALLKVAGKELQSQCKKIGSLQPGEMAKTGPAKLKCKHVFHVRSSHWDNGKGAPILQKLIQDCLVEVEKDKLISIAIPAIGTGNLHFPRSEVIKIFFEEVTNYLTARPHSSINDIRFVAYGKDQDTVNAFLGAIQEIKSKVSSPAIKPAPVPLPKARIKDNITTGSSNVTTTDKPDGSLELSLGTTNLQVEIVCADISKETTDVIMHVTSQDFSFNGGVGKALIKVGGDSIVQECQTLGQPALFTTHFTKAGNLSVAQIAHVIGPGKPSYADLKKCLDNFFDYIVKKNIAKVSFSAIGAGAMGYSESQSADLIFDNLFKIAESKNPALSLVRIVIFEKAKFSKFKDAAKAYITSGGATNPSPQTSRASSSGLRFSVFRSKKGSAKVDVDSGGLSVKIYSDDRGKLDKAWGEVKRRITQNIKEKEVSDDVIKKFTDGHTEKLRKLERDFDVTVKVDQSKGNIKIKGHIGDVSVVQEEIHKILKEIIENEPKVPNYWDKPSGQKFDQFNLPTSSKEYKDVETAFHKTAPNQIVRIGRIQNREIYELYNVKREAMMKKYGSNFAGKELMLFHGTSSENIPKINGGGLNRSYAGQHATVYGRGVYFARDASYSCQTTYSPPDSQGNRYMYYAKVLVGEYTNGNQSMIVRPNKGTTDPNETYDSVVDNVGNPSIYVMFQDYEYYTEYLITFR